MKQKSSPALKVKLTTAAGVAWMTFVIGSALSACGVDNEDYDPAVESPLYSPRLAMASVSEEPYSGFIQALPCSDDSYCYYGNLTSDGSLTSSPGAYTVANGYVSESESPLRLPKGSYTIVYFGHDTSEADISTDLDIPSLTRGDTLSGLQFGLLPRNELVYSPTHGLVVGRQSFATGDSLHADLTRVTAIVRIVVSNPSSSQSGGGSNPGGGFNPGGDESNQIDSVWVYLGNMAAQINAVTGEPGEQLYFVSFKLKQNDDGTQFESGDVHLFPSADNPPLILEVWSGGDESLYTELLSNTLSAGTITTINITMSNLFDQDNPIGEDIEVEEVSHTYKVGATGDSGCASSPRHSTTTAYSVSP